MPTTDTLLASPTPAAEKRAYVAPALVVHGTVQTITQMAGQVLNVGGGSDLSDPQG